MYKVFFSIIIGLTTLSLTSPSSPKELEVLRDRWTNHCPVPLNRLKRIIFSYYDFAGIQHNDGEIVVLDAVAHRVEKIFQELYQRKFPIDKAKPIEFYDGDDARSMADNNTSAYNCRRVTSVLNSFSLHAYGLAIDINPVQNPFFYFANTADRAKGIRHTAPIVSEVKYINRKRAQQDKLPGLAEDIVDVFEKNGFTIWGGTWNDPIDWQHFQTPRALANLLIIMNPDDAKVFFEMHVANSDLFTQLPNNEEIFVLAYQQDNQKFMNIFDKHKQILSMTPNHGIAYFKARWAE